MSSLVDKIKKNKDKNNYLYTKGKQYCLDEQEYVGEYHISKGKAFTGPIPSDDSKKLAIFNSDVNVLIYDKLKTNLIREFIDPYSALVEPKDSDYTNGVFVRYFVRRANMLDSPIYEINKSMFDKYNAAGGIDGSLYTLLQLNWAISKTEKSIDNIVRINQGNISVAERKFSGISNVIGNYFKYSFLVV